MQGGASSSPGSMLARDGVLGNVLQLAHLPTKRILQYLVVDQGYSRRSTDINVPTSTARSTSKSGCA